MLTSSTRSKGWPGRDVAGLDLDRHHGGKVDTPTASACRLASLKTPFRDTCKRLHRSPKRGDICRKLQGKQPELHEKAAFVPACPGKKPPLSRLASHDKQLNNNDNIEFVPVVPVVPENFRRGNCSAPCKNCSCMADFRRP